MLKFAEKKAPPTWRAQSTIGQALRPRQAALDRSTGERSESRFAHDFSKIDVKPHPSNGEGSWAERLATLTALAGGDQKNECLAEMAGEALAEFGATVHNTTNSTRTIDQAIDDGLYVPLSSGEPQVNFDASLNQKTGVRSGGQTRARYPTAAGGELQIFIILGPSALNAVGPVHTQAIFEHEKGHAVGFIDRFFEGKPGEAPVHGTFDEHVMIYTDSFCKYFLDLWTLKYDPDPVKKVATISASYFHIFDQFFYANSETQKKSFANIEDFYRRKIAGNACNTMKFKIWMQTHLNDMPGNLAVEKFNTELKLNLVRGDDPLDFFTAELAGCK